MKKLTLIFLLAIIPVAALLTGCSNNSPNTPWYQLQPPKLSFAKEEFKITRTSYASSNVEWKAIITNHNVPSIFDSPITIIIHVLDKDNKQIVSKTESFSGLQHKESREINITINNITSPEPTGFHRSFGNNQDSDNGIEVTSYGGLSPFGRNVIVALALYLGVSLITLSIIELLIKPKRKK